VGDQASFGARGSRIAYDLVNLVKIQLFQPCF
jgi:hypothetical protein